MGFCNRKCGTFCLLAFGTTFVVLGALLALLWSTIYNLLVTKELILTNHSRSYELWKETPIPMYLSLYLFNWTNADEVLRTKWAVKPEMQQCGPYVFSEHHIRVNLQWNDNGTVTYQQKRIWHFIPEISNGSLTDNITNINPIVLIVGKKVKSMANWIKELVNVALKGFEHNIATTRTVNELLFDGYEDPILNVISKLKVKDLKIPFSKFGWFYSRNNSATYDGNFTIYTGETGTELVGIMDLWNGHTNTTDYGGYCSYVNGTAGELWPPVKSLQQLQLFVSDVCSTLSLEYINDENVHGVIGKRYIATDYNFDNGTKYPEQGCFHGDKVVPSGVRDVSKCRYGAPLFFSYPHFYLADPSFLKGVNGLRPNKTEHEMYLALEANTGIPIDVRAQLQINLFVEPIPLMTIFENVKPTYMPVLWFRQTATLTKSYADMVKVLVALTDMGVYIGWGAFGIGLLMVLAGMFLICRRDWYDKETEHLLEDEAPES